VPSFENVTVHSDKDVVVVCETNPPGVTVTHTLPGNPTEPEQPEAA